MVIWRWVCILIAPDGFLAIRQGTESVRGTKISPETEISLWNAVSGNRSELQKAGSNNRWSCSAFYDIPIIKAFAWLHRVSMFEARVKSPGTKKRLEGQRDTLNVVLSSLLKKSWTYSERFSPPLRGTRESFRAPPHFYYSIELNLIQLDPMVLKGAKRKW